MKTAFLFPGQGAQVAGMGKDIAQAYSEAMALFDKANEIVGYDLKTLCFEGSEDKLAETTYSQPAIFVTSAAMLKVLTDSKPELKPDVTAGLSLGEYTALYAAGVLDFEQGLKLVQKRGQAMQEAADATDGSMVSLLGLDEEKTQALCNEAAQGDLLCPANFNCPGQIVISGSSQACSRAVDLAEKYGAIKAVQLKVAGAFHTSMMQPAADTLKQALEASSVSDPNDVKVIANINAEYYTNKQDICTGLVTQLVAPILWQKCMETLLSDDVETYYEIGPGRVLTGLMKRVHRKTRVNNISTLDSLNTVINS